MFFSSPGQLRRCGCFWKEEETSGTRKKQPSFGRFPGRGSQRRDYGAIECNSHIREERKSSCTAHRRFVHTSFVHTKNVYMYSFFVLKKSYIKSVSSQKFRF